MAQDKYRSVRLPEELVDQVEEVIKSGKYGYKSIAEFIKVAVRDELKEVEGAGDRK